MTVASRGPVPKRSDVTRRRNHKAEIDKTEDTGTELPYAAPLSWRAPVRRLWESLAESGMSQFYTPSDWAFAYITCGAIDEALSKPNQMTGQISFSAIKDLLASLGRVGVTEGDRRRMRIELEKEVPIDDPKIAIMDNYRRIKEAS